MSQSTSLRKRRTKRELLATILSDGRYHSTRELVRRVGHTFGGAVFQLRKRHHEVERRSHPTCQHQHQYRLVRYERT